MSGPIGDPIMRGARMRARRERATDDCWLRVRVPNSLRLEFRELARKEGLGMGKILRICAEGYVARDPSILGQIEQWRRENARPAKPQRPAKEMFSKNELQGIWDEINDGGEDDG